MSGARFRSVRGSRGFTLLELLAVIAIILILAAAVVPSLSSLLRASKLTTGSLTLINALNLARQTALTNNCPVEVRIYKTGVQNNPTDLQYRAVRLFTVDDSTVQPIGTLDRFSDSLIISSSTQLSSLMAKVSGTSALPADYPIPANTAYIGFRFRPNGGTDLVPVDSNWFMTLLTENGPANGSTGLPANFFTVEVDSITGRTRTFRP